MRYIAYFSLLLFLSILTACNDDKDTDPAKRPEISKNIAWIENTMRKNYYWYEEIPATDKLDYIKAEEDFFTSMLSYNDGKDYVVNGNKQHYYFSTIKKLTDQTKPSTYSGEAEYSYGFEFTSIYTNAARTTLQVLVQYIFNDSPAKESGLRRGDWITEIDGKPITIEDVSSISNGGGEMSLTIQRWNSNRRGYVTEPEKINMPAARQVIDNPVHMAKVITTSGKEKKVGYLVYNHFTRGVSNDNFSYDDELRGLSGITFDGIDEFVLDLRYNPGGNIASAILLCAILAPASALEKPFCYIQYNDKTSPKETVYKAGKEQLKSNGKNLNLSTIYVLVSSNSASASELVINSLRPYMDVVIIGEKTLGKNVASSIYTSDDNIWEMSPIIARIYNSERNSDYADGFFPDYVLNEAFTPTSYDPNIVTLDEVRELGDENERLLRVALNLIDNTDIVVRSAIKENAPVYTIAPFNSLLRKGSNGAIIDINR